MNELPEQIWIDLLSYDDEGIEAQVYDNPAFPMPCYIREDVALATRSEQTEAPEDLVEEMRAEIARRDWSFTGGGAQRNGFLKATEFVAAVSTRREAGYLARISELEKENERLRGLLVTANEIINELSS